MAKTSIYLDDDVHERLGRVAKHAKLKVNALLRRGVELVLAEMDDPEDERRRLAAEVEMLRSEASASAKERARLASKVQDADNSFRRVLDNTAYKKGTPHADAIAFWDLVMADAAKVIKAAGAAMTAEQILPALSSTLQSEACRGGEKITVGLLRKKMTIKAEHNKLFEIVEGGRFAARRRTRKPKS